MERVGAAVVLGTPFSDQPALPFRPRKNVRNVVDDVCEMWLDTGMTTNTNNTTLSLLDIMATYEDAHAARRRLNDGHPLPSDHTLVAAGVLFTHNGETYHVCTGKISK